MHSVSGVFKKGNRRASLCRLSWTGRAWNASALSSPPSCLTRARPTVASDILSRNPRDLHTARKWLYCPMGIVAWAAPGRTCKWCQTEVRPGAGAKLRVQAPWGAFRGADQQGTASLRPTLPAAHATVISARVVPLTKQTLSRSPHLKKYFTKFQRFFLLPRQSVKCCHWIFCILKCSDFQRI